MAVTPTVFGFIRTESSEDTVAVFINLGSKTNLDVKSLVDSNQFPPNVRGRVLAAVSTSKYNIGDHLNVNSFELETHEGLAFVIEEGSVTDGATTTFVSLTLMILSVVVFLM